MITYVTSTNDNYFLFIKIWTISQYYFNFIQCLRRDNYYLQLPRQTHESNLFFLTSLSWKKEVHLAEIKKENLRGVIKENVTNVDCGVLMGIFHS